MVQITASVLLDNKTGIYTGLHCYTEQLPLAMSDFQVFHFFNANLCICQGHLAHPTSSSSQVGSNPNSSLPFRFPSFLSAHFQATPFSLFHSFLPSLPSPLIFTASILGEHSILHQRGQWWSLRRK